MNHEFLCLSGQRQVWKN